jgi:hypothetical protein
MLFYTYTDHILQTSHLQSYHGHIYNPYQSSDDYRDSYIFVPCLASSILTPKARRSKRSMVYLTRLLNAPMQPLNGWHVKIEPMASSLEWDYAL